MGRSHAEICEQRGDCLRVRLRFGDELNGGALDSEVVSEVGRREEFHPGVAFVPRSAEHNVVRPLHDCASEDAMHRETNRLPVTGGVGGGNDLGGKDGVMRAESDPGSVRFLILACPRLDTVEKLLVVHYFVQLLGTMVSAGLPIVNWFPTESIVRLLTTL